MGVTQRERRVSAVRTTDKRLLEWLHDARAIERKTARMLKAFAKHLENFPEIKAQAEQLIRETGDQAGAIQDYVEQRSEESILVSSPPGATDDQSLSGAFIGSEALKRAMTEISGYNILLAAAESAGDSETRAVCDTIRRQEEAMVEWLRQFLGSATEMHVVRQLAESKKPRRAKSTPPGASSR